MAKKVMGAEARKILLDAKAGQQVSRYLATGNTTQGSVKVTANGKTYTIRVERNQAAVPAG